LDDLARGDIDLKSEGFYSVLGIELGAYCDKICPFMSNVGRVYCQRGCGLMAIEGKPGGPWDRSSTKSHNDGVFLEVVIVAVNRAHVEGEGHILVSISDDVIPFLAHWRC
jgi:hypothetical protein